jgi:hypothetical protein
VGRALRSTQPEGIGALHISSFRKSEGSVLDKETLSQLQKNCQDGTETNRVSCGDFSGHAAEYVDWSTGTCWKKWFVAMSKDSLVYHLQLQRKREILGPLLTVQSW